MYRRIQKQFRDGLLIPSSQLIQLPNIGPYLYERLRRRFSPRAQNITLRQIARATKNMTTSNLKEALQRTLQNERANQCVGRRGHRYHTRDINEMGWKTMVALFRILKVNADGYNIGAGMVANPQNIPYVAQRSHDAKYSPCKSRNICHAPNTWRNGLCQYTDNSGFEGIGNYPGQRIHNVNRNRLNQKESLGRALEKTPRDTRKDIDTARDVAAGHGGMRYSTVNVTTKQRRPGKIVRLPVRK